VSLSDSCIEALVVRGAIQMSRFLQGEPSDSFSWIEYDGSQKRSTAVAQRKGEALARLANGAYFSLIIGGSIYTLLLLLQREGVLGSDNIRIPRPQELFQSTSSWLGLWR
jgi:hypothetical protein